MKNKCKIQKYTFLLEMLKLVKKHGPAYLDTQIKQLQEKLTELQK